jgi:iron(III) transport system substrate-binding protein
MRSPRLAATLLAATALVAAGCGSDDDTSGEGADGTTGSGTTLTVYSGRSEELVAPVIEMFEEETGITVEVRYGDTAEMAAQILEEGDNSPADVFFGQDAGALGALSSAGVLAPVDQEVLDLVPEALRSTEGEWVGTSARARVVVYNTEAVTEAELPEGIDGYTEPEWEGRVGWAPTNGSFQSFVTAMRVLEGDDATLEWLRGMEDNGVVAYENNVAIVDAVAAGEVDAGFVNHYYLVRMQAEDPAITAANHFVGGGDPGGLVNVAGVGVLAQSDQAEAAERFAAFLLSPEAQEYFATETYEIPLVEGVEASDELPDFDELTVPELDLDQLEDLEGTLTLLQEAGVL